jgi:hypothetical protein
MLRNVTTGFVSIYVATGLLMIAVGLAITTVFGLFQQDVTTNMRLGIAGMMTATEYRTSVQWWEITGSQIIAGMCTTPGRRIPMVMELVMRVKLRQRQQQHLVLTRILTVCVIVLITAPINPMAPISAPVPLHLINLLSTARLMQIVQTDALLMDCVLKTREMRIVTGMVMSVTTAPLFVIHSS